MLLWVVFVLAVGTVAPADAGQERMQSPRRVESPAPAGTGGRLILTADPALCAHPDLELGIERRVQDEAGPDARYVFRTPVSSDVCEWKLDQLWPGAYTAVLRTEGRRGPPMAGVRFDIVANVTTAATVRPETVQIAGWIVIDGMPVDEGATLRAMYRSHAWEWTTQTGDAGEYFVTLHPPVPAGRVSLRVELPDVLLPWSTSAEFVPGLNRVDLDIPPGRIDLFITPPVRPPDGATLHVSVNGPRSTFGAPIEARPRRYVIVGRGYGRYEIRVQSFPGPQLLAEATVVLSEKEPTAEVVLPLAAIAPR